MVHLPNFQRRREMAQPIEFVTVERAFSPQVKVRATRDVSGWVDRRRRVKWHLGAGRMGYLDAEKAREFQVKGYVEILKGAVEPVSEDEAAEFLSTVTTLNLGAPNG